MRMFIASHGISDFPTWLATFKEVDKKTSYQMEELKADLRLACSGPNRNDGTKTCVVIQTYPKSNEAAIKDCLKFDAPPFSGDDGLISRGIVIPPFEPCISAELWLDKWEIDPATLSDDEELMVYVGGHGVLNFDRWFKLFQEYPHDKEFPGVVRTLAGKGPKHTDGTDTCVYVHIFKKSYEKLVRDLMFGQEKKLVIMEHSVVLPYQPDIHATVGYMAGWK